MNQAPVLTALGICCALGMDKQQVLQQALAGSRAGMVRRDDLLAGGHSVIVGAVTGPLPDTRDWPQHWRSRNNQLAAQAFQQIAGEVHDAILRYGATRVAVVIGTSTSGIADGEEGLARRLQDGQWPENYHYQQQEMGAPAQFIAELAGAEGPAYAISTACSSSARALMSARLLLQAGIADAVVVGGADSLCRLTLRGFSALASVSAGYCQPFGRGRDGINIGEGAALFLLERQVPAAAGSVIRLSGSGASADAHHMSAPHPDGDGAERAIRQALNQAGVQASELSYINAHGTATPLNDQVESLVLHRLGAAQVPVSSSKSLTGHTLGAAGAIEAALCWLLLSDYNSGQHLIPQVRDVPADPALAALTYAQVTAGKALRHCLSNSFAFGGNNMAIVLSKDL